MPQITAILSTGSKSLLKLILDNNSIIRIDYKTFGLWELKKGDNLTSNQIKQLKHEVQQERIVNRVKNYLSYRPRSKSEILSYLRKKLPATTNNDEKDKIVESIIAKLKREGYVSDDAFSDWWIEQRTKNKPKGNYAILYELRAKGITENMIKEKLTTRDEEGSARSLVAKKYPNIKQGDIQARRKAYAFLQRKGFSWDTIRKVVDEVMVKK